MRSLVLLVLAVLATARAGIVTVPGLGDVLGTEIESSWTKRTIHAFYGIRFAFAPSGSRRFAPPVSVEPWDGLYDATSPGRKCPELLKYQNMTTPDEDLEDCLFLNVFTHTISESVDKASLLPVMVYIHGGGFYEGSATYFPPNYLMEKDIVLVVIQYRLGPLGFLSLETDSIAGNMGFMDQVLALKWVKQNIGSFGGDSNQITVFGQSAGGASISLLLMSPMVEKGLIQKVIMQSGTAFSNWVIDEKPTDFARALYQELTNITEEVDTSILENRFRNASVQEYHFAIQSLLSKNPSQLSKLGQAVIQKAGYVKFLERLPSDLAKEGKIHTVPMMVGNTKHDGSYLVTLIYDSLEAYGLVNDSNYLRSNLTSDVSKLIGYQDVTDAFYDILENKFFKKIFDEERYLNFADVAPGLTDIAGMPGFKAPSLKHAKLNSQYDKPTFLYTFDYVGQYTRFGYGADTSKYPFAGGVHHSNDLLYLFPYHYPIPLNDNDTRIAQMMVDFWTSFAIDGKPSSPGSEAWEPLKTGRNGPYYHINTNGYLDQDFVENEYSAATNEISS